MAKICGTSEQARLLKNMIRQSMQQVQSAVGDMERAVKNIKSGWNDEGSAEVDEMLSTIKRALGQATEAAPNVENALESYAELLDQR